MKKLLLILLILSIFLLTGCANTPPTNKDGVQTKHWKAIIDLPDGTIVEGNCSDYIRISSNWIVVIVDGVKYKLNDWRVAIIEK